MKKEINVSCDVTVKKTSDVRKVKFKAVAGMSERELVQKHTIGEFDEGDNVEGEEEQANEDNV
jgi:hypothetical protein